MAETNDMTRDSTLRDDARLNIMMALEAAKAMNDELLIYLMRMALNQLYEDEPQSPTSSPQLALQ